MPEIQKVSMFVCFQVHLWRSPMAQQFILMSHTQATLLTEVQMMPAWRQTAQLLFLF